MANEQQPRVNENQGLIDAIENELGSIDESNFPHVHTLVQNELYRLRGGIAEWIDVVGTRKAKIRSKVMIPVDQYPGYNFVGKLLGPGGSTLKGIQEQTMTKMAILGTGSMRNEAKEKEMLDSGDPKYQHLKQKLHLQIDSLGTPSEAYYRLSHALAEVKKFMTPEAEGFGGDQMGGGGWGQQGRGGGRGMGRGGRGGGMGRGGAPRGAMRGRGGRGRGAAGGGDFGAAPNGMESYGGGDGYEQAAPGYDMNAGYDQSGGYGGGGAQPGYESFGGGYEQTDSWGKMGGGRGAPAGRGHPYSRPPAGGAGAPPRPF